MSKIILSYIPEEDANTYILKSIENTLLNSQIINTYIDFNVFYNTNEDINISKYTINTDEVIQKHINYVKEDELLNNIKSSLRINKNTIILIGYNNLKFDFIKELSSIMNEYEDIFVNILIKLTNKKLKNISIHEITVEENMNWQEIEQNIKDKLEEDINNKKNEPINFIDFLNKITNLSIEPIISCSDSIIPITATIESFNDDNENEELDDLYKSISYIDKNNALTIEKISEDLICIYDDEGNKILLNEESKNFLINNLKDLI